MRNRTFEPVDEYAETQVLTSPTDRTAERDSDALSLYTEYERDCELAPEAPPRPVRKRR